MSQTQQTPGWGPPTTPQPPKPKRQFTVTKIAIGVAAGIALFLIGSIVLVAVLLSSDPGGKQATAVAPSVTEFTPPASAPPDETATDEPAATEPPASSFMGLQLHDAVTVTSEGTDSADLAITAVRRSTQALDQYSERPQHGYFLIATIKVKGIGAPLDLNGLDFEVVTADGRHWESSTAGLPNELSVATVAKGETLTAEVVFDEPAKHGQIVYTPNLGDAAIASWKF
jgi:hypothetical protein